MAETEQNIQKCDYFVVYVNFFLLSSCLISLVAIAVFLFLQRISSEYSKLNKKEIVFVLLICLPETQDFIYITLIKVI